MILKHLSISRAERWQDSSTPLIGSATFTGDKGELKIQLNEETSKKIIAVCAAQLVETAKESANNMTAELIQQHPALENKQE